MATTADRHIDTGTDELLCEVRDRVAVITLNRPQARNALSDRLSPALREMIRLCRDDAGVGAVLVTGAGGSIGSGLPMATGAAIACPERTVINMEGDGSSMYTIQALWTQAREKLNVVTVIFANRGYQILRGELVGVGAKTWGERAERMLSIVDPDISWVKLAEGMGVEAASADNCETLVKLLRHAVARPGPFLIEARIGR